MISVCSDLHTVLSKAFSEKLETDVQKEKKEREKKGGRSLVTCRPCELGSPLLVEGKRLHLVLIMVRVGECAL